MGLESSVGTGDDISRASRKISRRVIKAQEERSRREKAQEEIHNQQIKNGDTVLVSFLSYGLSLTVAGKCMIHHTFLGRVAPEKARKKIKGVTVFLRIAKVIPFPIFILIEEIESIGLVERAKK